MLNNRIAIKVPNTGFSGGSNHNMFLKYIFKTIFLFIFQKFKTTLIVTGIIITASVLLAVPGINSSTCTSYAALSEPCGCTISKDNLDPLCGSDGGTYLNECFLECEKTLSNVDIRIDHKGMCQGDARCSCHPRYEPVCASNGVTYSNDCVLQCNIRKDPSIRLNHKGECQSDAPSRYL